MDDHHLSFGQHFHFHITLSWFDAAWRVVPTQALMYLFIWLGGVLALQGDGAPVGFEALGLGISAYHAWHVLCIGSPMLVMASRLIIYFLRGRWRVFGFWLRLGGDLGVLMALIAYLAARVTVLQSSISNAALFALTVVAGVLALVVAWVVRDVGAIVALEKLTTRLHKETLCPPTNQ